MLQESNLTLTLGCPQTEKTMTDKATKTKHLLERLKDFQRDNADFNIDSFEEWKKEVIAVLHEKQKMRFTKLTFFEVVDDPFDDDLPF